MQKLAEWLVPKLAWLYLRFVGHTSKICWLNSDKLKEYQSRYGNALYALWHGRQFFFPFAYRNQPVSVIVSQSKDGEYIAKTMELFGMKAVRGSSSKGGARALIALKREMESGRTVAVTPDGPRGPQKKVAGGILLLSKKTGKPILPITYSSKYKLIFRGWDEYWVPLPFSRILINYGSPVFVGEEDDLQSKALELERELNRLTQVTDEMLQTETFFYSLYTLFFILASPFILSVFILKYKRFFFKNFFSGMGERLGNLSVSSQIRNPIWMHAASLGEGRAAAPLAIALKKKVPSSSIVFSASTGSGLAEAEKNQLADFYFYAPLDIPWVLKKVFNKICPRLLLLVESELWPNWLRVARMVGCKVIVVNGRMSEKSASRYAKLGKLSKIILNKIDFVCAREKEDAERFERAGIPKEKIKITGNLKYDWIPWSHSHSAKWVDASTPSTNSPFVKGWHSEGMTKYWILTAGSIRQGEEKLILEAYLKLKNKHPQLKLILAPRHFASLLEIEKLLFTNGISFCRKSLLTMDDGLWTMDCLLWDSFGDLWQAYQISTIVFVGGSLLPLGGQNPIEPAWFAKPVLFGPYMENFAEPAKLLLQTGGAIQIKNSTELIEKIEALLSYPEKIKQTGETAKKSVEQFFGQATEKTMEALYSYVQL